MFCSFMGRKQMRNMSFMLTTQQILNETKIVTRRLGWWFLKAGDIVMACEKCQGLKKGEKIKRLKEIKIFDTKPQELKQITLTEVILEGFPNLSPLDFIDMFCKEMKCTPETIVNRIEFRYLAI